ncbi:MAG: replication-associated recombination protein A [Planctomycetes bacterium]|nr:replication-associated recombination protein A [Planctomycetota bacterium]
MDLFSESEDSEPADAQTPLAERMRPATLDELEGQEELIGEGSLLRDLLEHNTVPSMILWGPPGCGKTSLARLFAGRTGSRFVAFSAVLSGVKEVREVVAEARWQRKAERRGTVLFVDEIHRFNKSQQDAFLPHIEDGTIVLVGATTENPSFALNAALLSRCQVFTLKPHTKDSLSRILRRALTEAERYGLPVSVQVADDAIERLVATSPGDARGLLNRLESLMQREAAKGHLGKGVIDGEAVDRALKDRSFRYDRGGEDHFNVMSAFHKSMRGGDPQAALYWMARMLTAGEDPLWVARRIVRFASEDVGLADPQALPIALAARDSYRALGSPEGDLALAQAAVYMATAPKSNAVYEAFNRVTEVLQKGGVHEVPMALRNAPTKLMKQLGHGKGYVYPHDLDDAVSDQDYLPEELKGRRFYEPSPFGHEKEITRRMKYWDELRQTLRSKKANRDD